MELPSTTEQKEKITRRRAVVGLMLSIPVVLFLLLGRSGLETAGAQSPNPTPDRLAEPEVSNNPSQYERGRYLYWMHCMPCHGDIGQGLTDEFREIWVEDHQNCWARGCHGGRVMDEGFPVPRDIPAVISENGEVLAFSSPEELYEYLYTTHPPQSPGYLTEEEYWDMTAYVLVENNLLSTKKEIGPFAKNSPIGIILGASAIGLLFLIIIGVRIWTKGSKKDDFA